MKKKLSIVYGIKATPYGETPRRKQKEIKIDKINICLNCKKLDCKGVCEALKSR